jgi:hypothetical protein
LSKGVFAFFKELLAALGAQLVAASALLARDDWREA